MWQCCLGKPPSSLAQREKELAQGHPERRWPCQGSGSALLPNPSTWLHFIQGLPRWFSLVPSLKLTVLPQFPQGGPLAKQKLSQAQVYFTAHFWAHSRGALHAGASGLWWIRHIALSCSPWDLVQLHLPLWGPHFLPDNAEVAKGLSIKSPSFGNCHMDLKSHFCHLPPSPL